MTAYYAEDELQKRLGRMCQRDLVLFALFVAERLFLNFSVFSKEQSWGDVAVLRTGLDMAWKWLADERTDTEGLESLIEECESQAPDTETFDSLFVSAALDAAIATANVLKLVADGDSELAIENGTFGRDTVDLYVQEIESMPANSSDLEERIRLHPLMQNEIAAQYDAIRTIESGISVDGAAQRWRSKERSNLDLEG